MKQCPVCRTNYTDETLQFCLSDGAKLNAVEDDAKTIEMSAERRPIRVDFQKDSVPTVVPLSTAPSTPKKGCSPLLIGGLLVFLLFALGAIAVAVYLFAPFGTKTVVTNSSSNSSPTPKNNADVDDINGKLANLEKQLEEQKKQKQMPAPSSQPFATQKPTPVQISPATSQTASVAPTGDGFLSLRTEPSVKTGTQLVKIPTGATVNLLGKCQNPGQTVDGKTGRWCLVSYNNQTGWVFDAYLNY